MVYRIPELQELQRTERRKTGKPKWPAKRMMTSRWFDLRVAFLALWISSKTWMTPSALSSRHKRPLQEIPSSTMVYQQSKLEQLGPGAARGSPKPPEVGQGLLAAIYRGPVRWLGLCLFHVSLCGSHLIPDAHHRCRLQAFNFIPYAAIAFATAYLHAYEF